MAPRQSNTEIGIGWWGVGSQQSVTDSAVFHDLLWKVQPDLLIEIGTWCASTIPPHPAPAPRLSCPFTPFHPIPTHPISPHPIPSHPIPSHLIPSTPFHPTPSHPIPSHQIQSHCTPSPSALSLSYSAPSRSTPSLSLTFTSHLSSNVVKSNAMLPQCHAILSGSTPQVWWLNCLLGQDNDRIQPEGCRPHLRRHTPRAQVGVQTVARCTSARCRPKLSQPITSHSLAFETPHDHPQHRPYPLDPNIAPTPAAAPNFYPRPSPIATPSCSSSAYPRPISPQGVSGTGS